MQTSIIVVSDMADLKALPIKFLGREFMFACREGKQLHGWVPDQIFITARAHGNMSEEVKMLIDKRKAQGSQICPAS